MKAGLLVTGHGIGPHWGRSIPVPQNHLAHNASLPDVFADPAVGATGLRLQPALMAGSYVSRENAWAAVAKAIKQRDGPDISVFEDGASLASAELGPHRRCTCSVIHSTLLKLPLCP